MYKNIALAAVFGGIASFGLRGILPELVSTSDQLLAESTLFLTPALAGSVVMIYRNAKNGKKDSDSEEKK